MSHQSNPNPGPEEHSVHNQDPLKNQVNYPKVNGDLNMKGAPISNNTAQFTNKQASSMPYVLVAIALLVFALLYINHPKPYFLKKPAQLNHALKDSNQSTKLGSSQTSSTTIQYYPVTNQKKGPHTIKSNLGVEINGDRIPKVLRDALVIPSKTTRLDLARKNLYVLPSVIGKLYNLNRLTITRNHLINLPNEFTLLHKLTHLYARYNEFKVFPESLLKLPNLTHLYLRGNKIKKIPSNIDQMIQLYSLHLSNNRLKSLPKSIAKLPKLKILYLKGNPISTKERKRIKSWLPHCKIIFD